MRAPNALLVTLALAGLITTGFFLFQEDLGVRRGAPGPEAGPRAAEVTTGAGPRTSDGADGAGRREAPAPTTGPLAAAGVAPEGESSLLDEFSIGGRVVDVRGEPVAGARIYAARGPRLEGVPLEELDPVEMPWSHRTDAVSGPAGRFRLAPPGTGALWLSVRARGFAPLDRRLFEQDGANDLGSIVLDDSVLLSGRVRDAAGEPVAGAVLHRLHVGVSTVVLPGRTPGVAVATTDDQGTFRVDELGPGPWKLLIASEDHPDRIERGETDRPGEVVSDLEFVLEVGAEIQGRVVQASPEALGELWVLATRRVAGDESPSFRNGETAILAGALPPVRCAADGRFTLRGLQRDSVYRLEARDGEHAFIGRQRTAPVVARAGERDVELVYRPRTALEFQVVDARTSEPVTELEVRVGFRFMVPLTDDDGGVRRDFPEGRVRFENLFERPPGESTGLAIDARGYEELRLADLDLIEGKDLDLGILRLDPSPLLEVRVLDHGTGEPVADALVTLAEEGSTDPPCAASKSDGSPWRSARTDRDGRALLHISAGERARLSVRHDAFAPFLGEALLLPLPDDHEETVRLRAGGSLVVEVVDARGAPVPLMGIRHRGPGDEGRAPAPGSIEPPETDAQGQRLFAHLEEGMHRFRVDETPTGSRTMDEDLLAEGTWSEVSLSDGSEETLRLVVPIQSRLTGRVTEGGRPLSGAWLRLTIEDTEPSLSPASRGGLEARTNGNGQYAFKRVETGRYRVSISQRSRAMVFHSDLRVGEEDSAFDVDLPVAVIEGRLLGEDGLPIAGLRVRAARARAKDGATPVAFRSNLEADDLGGDSENRGSSFESVGDRVLSDAQGRYVLRGVESDVDLVVEASGKDYLTTESRVLRVAPDQIRAGVDLKLARGATLEVQVLRAAGFRGTKCLVQVQPDEARGIAEDARRATTDTEGVVRFAGLEPGPWRIRVEAIARGSEGEVTPAQERVVVLERGQVHHASVELY